MNKYGASTYITAISAMGDRYGNLLVSLMERYGAIGLKEITVEQAKQFYEELKGEQKK